MTEFLVFILLVWVIWLTRRTRHAGKTESGVTDLTARLNLLEQEVAKLRGLIQADRQQVPAQPAAIPKTAVPPIERAIEPPAAVAPPVQALPTEPPPMPMVPSVERQPPIAPPQPPPVAPPRFATPEPSSSLRDLLNLETTIEMSP